MPISEERLDEIRADLALSKKLLLPTQFEEGFERAVEELLAAYDELAQRPPASAHPQSKQWRELATTITDTINSYKPTADGLTDRMTDSMRSRIRGWNTIADALLAAAHACDQLLQERDLLERNRKGWGADNATLRALLATFARTSNHAQWVRFHDNLIDGQTIEAAIGDA